MPLVEPSSRVVEPVVSAGRACRDLPWNSLCKPASTMDVGLTALVCDAGAARIGGMSQQIRRVAVLGGNRLPFARSNSVYADASNQEMLTAAIDGLATRFGIEGERLGEVVAGAVLKHARDFHLVRESVL